MAGCEKHGLKRRLGCRTCQAAVKIKKLVKAGKVELASQQKLEEHYPEVAILLHELGFYHRKVLVTDLSSFRDFPTGTDANCLRISKKIGVRVHPKDGLADAAERWRNLEGKEP